MMQKGGVKILRPRQLYVGEGKRDYVDIEGRTAAPTSIGSEPTEVPHIFSKRAFLADYKDKNPRPSKL